MERWTDGFPAGDGHAFSDPLSWGSSSSILPVQTAFEVSSACEYSEIQQLLEETQDESHLTDLLGIASSPTSSDYGKTLQTCAHVPPEIEKVRERRWRPIPYTALSEQEEAPATTILGSERGRNEEDDEEEEERREGGGSTRLLQCQWRRRPVPAPTPRDEGDSASSVLDLLAYIPKSGSGQRRPRKKGNGWLLADRLGDLCSASKSKQQGSASKSKQQGSASKSKQQGQRNANEHWDPEEVKLLVDGVSELGIGRWTKLKKRWFPNSNSVQVRTAMNLKDKWRNLVIGYVLRPTSKKKAKNAHLDKDLINKIQMLAAHDPYPK